MKDLMNLFISPACAQTSGANFGGFDLMSLLPLVLIFVVFYIFLIRPQQKKAQQQKDLLSSLTRGDRVLTAGGLIGVISKVINDQELQVEIADGIKVRVARAMIADRISSTEPKPEIVEEKKSTKKPTAPKSAVKKKTSK